MTSNFSFSHSVFKMLVSQGRQNVSLCGNGLIKINKTFKPVVKWCIKNPHKLLESNVLFDEIYLVVRQRRLRSDCIILPKDTPMKIRWIQ